MKKNYLLLMGICCIFSCQDYSEELINPEEVITSVIIQPRQIDADGESQAIIAVTFPTGLAREKAIADIRTSSGIFRESGKDLVTINGNLEKGPDNTMHQIGRATLVSPNVEGEAVITTRIAGYARTDKLQFHQAFADLMVIETDVLELKKGPDYKATITVTLLRTRGRGKPSTNSNVSLTLKDQEGNNHGIIQPTSNQTGADGKCKFVLSRGADNYIGPLILEATNPQSAQPLTKSIQIHFVD